MKRENGSLTVEASLVLFVFLFFFLFFMSFAKYSAVQNKVKHSLNQTAISMSARNNQLVMLSKVMDKAVGISTDNIAEWIAAFGQSSSVSTKLGVPYTSSTTDIAKDTTAVWNDNDMKREIIRFFAYYYIDLSFKDSENMSYDDVCKKLSQAGLTDVEIKGGNSDITQKNSYGKVTTYNQFIYKNDLTIVITYKIKTGMSFHSIFGLTDDMEFTDSISAKLMK